MAGQHTRDWISRRTSRLPTASLCLIVGVLVFGLNLTAASADTEQPFYRTELTVTKAAFYTIDENGRSTREPAPSVAVIGDPETLTAESTVRFIVRSKPSRRAAPRKSAEPATAAPVNAYDPFDEYRCERFGFYYTKDNRCILPAWGSLRHRHDSPPRKINPAPF